MSDNFSIFDKDGNAVVIGAKDKTTYKNSKQYVDDGDNESFGAKADSAASTDTGTFSFIALFKRMLQKLTTGLGVFLTPQATVGLTVHSLVSAATTNATSVTSAATKLYNAIITNSGTSVAYCKIYDKASAPAPASDTPILRLMLPAGGGVRLPDGFGVALASGLAYVTVTGSGDTDVTAVAAGQVLVNLFYKT